MRDRLPAGCRDVGLCRVFLVISIEGKKRALLADLGKPYTTLHPYTFFSGFERFKADERSARDVNLCSAIGADERHAAAPQTLQIRRRGCKRGCKTPLLGNQPIASKALFRQSAAVSHTYATANHHVTR